MIKSNQNGRSMIEMLGVLAIIGVLSVGGIIGYSKAMSQYKSNQIMNGISHTIANIKTLFLQQDNVSSLDTQMAHDAGIIPDEFDSSDIKNLKAVVHSYGGKVKVIAKSVPNDKEDHDDAALTGKDVTYFAIKIEGLPKEVAMEIATKYWGDSGDLVSINLNDGNQANSNTTQETVTP